MIVEFETDVDVKEAKRDVQDAVDLANLLNRRLREVTDEYLVHHNKHRPDVLASIQGPSIIPGV